jgi:starvation-inducible DNA-binding protein
MAWSMALANWISGIFRSVTLQFVGSQSQGVRLIAWLSRPAATCAACRAPCRYSPLARTADSMKRGSRTSPSNLSACISRSRLDQSQEQGNGRLRKPRLRGSLSRRFTIMSTQTATKQKSNAVIEGLQTVLADSYALMAQTHLAHWNVEGPNFFQLHKAFQAQYEELFGAVDEIAERLRALDALAIGGLKTLAKASRIEELAVEEMPAKDFVAHLIESHEIVAADAHTLREAAGASDDLETQDLIIGRLQVHQKTLWMLKSFLKNL